MRNPDAIQLTGFLLALPRIISTFTNDGLICMSTYSGEKSSFNMQSYNIHNCVARTKKQQANKLRRIWRRVETFSICFFTRFIVIK